MASSMRLKVEHLVAATITGAPLPEEILHWLAGLDDSMHVKLARVGLVEPRSSARLGDFLTKFIEGRIPELKPASIVKLEQTKAKLLEHFPVDTPLRSITPDQASDWRVWLTQKNLSTATVKQHIGNGKTFFNEAARRQLVSESPFRHLAGGATASQNTRYMSPVEAEQVLDSCPNLQWKLLFGLARHAGLRAPSETHLLTWADMDFEKSRLRVRSPKTEHHLGHEQRLVPITPQLMAILQDAFDGAEEGQQSLCTMKVGGQTNRALPRIVRAAGVPEWDDAFQTLRRSCEIEWAQTFPQYAVSKWIGHSITVSGKHYANNVPDELFAKAAQKAAQHGAESTRTDVKSRMGEESKNAKDPEKLMVMRDDAHACNDAISGAEGIRTPVPLREIARKIAVLAPSQKHALQNALQIAHGGLIHI